MLVNYNFSVHTKPEKISIDGMIEPRIYNNGLTTMKIDGISLLPGESFSFGTTGAKMQGQFQLVFINEVDKRNEARLFFGTEINCEV